MPSSPDTEKKAGRRMVHEGLSHQPNRPETQSGIDNEPLGDYNIFVTLHPLRRCPRGKRCGFVLLLRS